MERAQERVSWTLTWLDLEPEMETRRGGRAEGLMNLAAWIDGDTLEFIKMSGGEDDTGDMPSTGGTSGPMAVERPYNRSAGDVCERPWLNDRAGGAGRGTMARGKSA